MDEESAKHERASCLLIPARVADFLYHGYRERHVPGVARRLVELSDGTLGALYCPALQRSAKQTWLHAGLEDWGVYTIKKKLLKVEERNGTNDERKQAHARDTAMRCE